MRGRDRSAQERAQQDGSEQIGSPQDGSDAVTEVLAPIDQAPSAESEFAALVETTSTEAGAARTGGWGRVFHGNRGLWITAAVAVVALAGGLVLGRFVISPIDAAAGAGAPEPGLVTVPVEFGELSNDVTLRGDVGYTDAVELKIDTSSFTGPAVVTGQVPEAGAELDRLSVALEVAGRPVIVLPGALPAYRTLRVGVSGPDVLQLKETLAAAGIGVGDAASDVFDEATALAVGELYNQVGYPTPDAEEGVADTVIAAEDSVRMAEQSLADARAALAAAGQGPSDIEVREADNQIASLNRQVAAADAAGEDSSDLRDQLALAQLQRQALDAPRDTSAEQGAVDAAIAGVETANASLAEARQAALPYLPASEVLYLEDLPRRVDAVDVERGTALEGAAMTVSGAAVELTGTAAAADVELLEVGAEASFELPDGAAHRAVIAAIEPAEDGGRTVISFEPDPLSPEQMEQVQGTNVRIEVPVGATDGEVLSVPYAALTAGPGGESRLEIVTGDPRDGESAETRMVTVETGLAAGGYVEVTATEGDLAEGDLVVVGS